jgi:hypothetical protein
MSIQVVQDHVDLFAWVVFNNAVHKVQKFPSSSAVIVAGFHLAGRYVESSEKSCRTVSLIAVRLTKQGSSGVFHQRI